LKTFKELGVEPLIIKAVEEIGFDFPLPVQEQVIPHLLQSETDITALAQTGTGKTAAYGIPIIQKTDTTINKIQALILCPTRELCIQISDDLTDFSKYTTEIKVLPVYGGASIENQIKALNKGVHIVVATPGRLIDLIDRKCAKLSSVVNVVLDEADEMLNMGFSDSIDKIFSHLPKKRNVLLFSATMPAEIERIAANYMKSPVEITIGTKNAGAENIRHICFMVNQKEKYLTLKRIADYYPNIYGIIFCRTRRETQAVADKLINDGYNAEALHGDLSQSQRDLVMQKFRIKNIQLLVATDVAARGIDVDNLTHIINYNLPETIDAYTHRSGRTARAGKTGISIAIITPKDKDIIKRIEKKIGKQFVWGNVPEGKDICEKQLYNLIEKLERVEIDEDEIAPLLPVIYRKLDWLSKEELIKRLVSVEFNSFLQYYKNAEELKSVHTSQQRKDKSGRKAKNEKRGKPERERRTERNGSSVRREKSNQKAVPQFVESRDAAAGTGKKKLYINIGKIDGLHPEILTDMVYNHLPEKRINIGKIEIEDKYTVFEVDGKNTDAVIDAFRDENIGKRKIVIKEDEAGRGKTKKIKEDYKPKRNSKKSRSYQSGRNKSNRRKRW
jgi:ATP-dependent RNA helicase DeaD